MRGLRPRSSLERSPLRSRDANECQSMSLWPEVLTGSEPRLVAEISLHHIAFVGVLRFSKPEPQHAAGCDECRLPCHAETSSLQEVRKRRPNFGHGKALHTVRFQMLLCNTHDGGRRHATNTVDYAPRSTVQGVDVSIIAEPLGAKSIQPLRDGSVVAVAQCGVQEQLQCKVEGKSET
jgi:hypothetical protein